MRAILRFCFPFILATVAGSASQSSAEIPDLLTSSGLLYHGLGFQQIYVGGLLGSEWRYPKDVFEYWQYGGGLYQRSMSYVNDINGNVLASPVGVLLDPLNPEVFIHLMAQKDVNYEYTTRRYAFDGKLSEICRGKQGEVEANRAYYNAKHWRYTTFINQCYEETVRTLDPEKILDADGVKYFSGSPIEALKETNAKSKELQKLKEAPMKSNMGPMVECPTCLWNEVVVSAPLKAMAGIVMWNEDPNQPISDSLHPEAGKYSGYWFSEACRHVKQYNPDAKCYHLYGGVLHERPEGTAFQPAQPSPSSMEPSK